MSTHPQPGMPPPTLLPPLGCLATVVAMFLLCLMPLFLLEVMTTALERLHLSGPMAGVVVVAIVLGSVVNIPVYRFTRDDVQPEVVLGLLGVGMLAPQYRHLRRESIVAVNVGGCLVPALLAAWEVLHLARSGGGVLAELAVVVGANVAVCYFVARPVPGIGIMMPAFVAPLVAVGGTWLAGAASGMIRPEHLAPIAFVAGVSGPILGADVLHLRDLIRTPVGMMSIGGAGTFDGIVLSGVLAALLA